MEIVRFILAALGISAISYFTYVVAYVFEGRKPGNGVDDIPVWRDQSRAFLPGDIGLGLAVAAVIWLPNPNPSWAQHWSWYFGSLATGLIVFFIGRRVLYAADSYTPEQWRSPSKRWHDFVMYFGFTTVVFATVVPKLFTNWHSDNALLLSLLTAGLAFWIAGIVIDVIEDDVPNDRQHPHNYRPIWAKVKQ